MRASSPARPSARPPARPSVRVWGGEGGWGLVASAESNQWAGRPSLNQLITLARLIRHSALLSALLVEIVATITAVVPVVADNPAGAIIEPYGDIIECGVWWRSIIVM